jgi:nicotinamidase-related amidase
MNDQQLDANDIIIAFIDAQEGIVNVGATNDPQRLRTAIAALADLARIFALPVRVSCVPTTGGTIAPLLAELAARLPDAEPLVRTTPNAMNDPPFAAALAAVHRGTLIIAGIATEVAVRQAALAARRANMRTIIAVDACSGLDPRTEAATFTHLAANGIDLTTVATIAAELAGDFASESGRAAMRVLQSTLVVRSHDHDT